MPVPNVSRRNLTRAVAATATAAAALGAVVLGAGSASAATSTLITITKVNVHRVQATTANQVIAVSGTGFAESAITGVAVNGCTAPTYIVQNPTTLLIKTDNTCATTSTGLITVTDSASNTAVSVPSNAAMGLQFVNPPTIATNTASLNNMVTLNSATVAYANQITTASTKGGTAVKVTAGTVPFTNSTAYPLAASLGGVAMTKVVMATGGGSFTAVLGAHAAAAAPVLSITSNGVTQTFASHAGGASGTAGTQDFAYAGTSISVAPAFGPITGGTVISITGAGFTSGTTATVGGANCPVSGTPTATLFKCTVAAVTAAAPATVVTTTGGVSSVIGAGSTYTFVSQ